MAENDLKRIPVKYIRDYIKKNYKSAGKCYICDSNTKLEIHHLFSLSDLFLKWCSEKKIGNINSVEQIKELRIQFEIDYRYELSAEHLYTLCKPHHERLHNIFGQNYDLRLVPKVKNWLEELRKRNGIN